jgi:GTP pyrophosphokinase
MVKVREDHPVFQDGTVDLDAWLARIQKHATVIDGEELLRACRIARVADQTVDVAHHQWFEGLSAYKTGLDMAEMLSELNMDQESLVACVLYRCVREGKLPIETVKDQFGPHVTKLIQGVLQMAAMHQAQNPAKQVVLGQRDAQLESIRKMLVTMVNDVRVALIKLAERTCAIRAVKNAPEARRHKVAREVFDIYAPLAHRLGVGQIKWELEDLSFRYLEPDQYKQIASLLDEKRLDRQTFIQQVTSLIRQSVAEANIEGAQIDGRAKHIYSIWRKMQRKQISFSQVYDVRAVRILVKEIKDCYSVLGLVHTLWRNIPKEFDDYIANPKANGYQSLHTAVIGPEGKVLEVQIRTYDMHEDAEKGVCAHYKYKGTDTNSQSSGYEQKISWLRQVMDWHDELGGIDELVAEFGPVEATEDRIYVLTPDGHVVDLQSNATPIDFAYKVHTEVGNSCRGAKVNGRIVPLTYLLHTGDQVEVLTTKNGKPSRDWLNQDLGYVNTSRARAKIKAWFKIQNRDQNIEYGAKAVKAELSRFGLKVPDMNKLAQKVNFENNDDLMAAIGAGDVRLMQVIHAAEQMLGKADNAVVKVSRPSKKPNSGADVQIHGVGSLLTVMARCCEPLPGNPIVGYITQGRGVSIHKQDCINGLQLKADEPERIVEVSWTNEKQSFYAVTLDVDAYDRTGLLRDIMNMVANEGVNATSVNTLTDAVESMARTRLQVEVESIEQLGRLMARMRTVPNVMSVSRTVDSPK